MDVHYKEDVPNPREKASIFSKLFFLWIFPLFCKGAKQDLGIDDMYDCPKDDHATQCGTRLEKAWDEHLLTMKKRNKKPKFYKVLWSVFGKSYVLFGLFTLFDECIIRVAQPILLRLFIRSFIDHSVSSSDQLMYASGVCLTSLIHALLMHPVSFGILHLGMKCRISTSSLIYRKTLRLSKAAQEQTPIGQLINLLSNDVNRFDFNVLFLPYLFIGPLQTVIFAYFLWEELGIACFAGTGFVLMLMPLQYYIGKLSRLFRFRLALKTDERGKVINEIINAMRVLKMYAWERPFESIVQRVRREEVKALRKRAYLRSFYFSMFATSSKLVPYITFVIYVLLGNELTADKVFFALPIFTIVIHNMVSTLPSAAAGVGELSVATKRIQQFLMLEEQCERSGVEVRQGQETQTLIAEGKLMPSIHMENVTARWTNNMRSNDLNGVTTKGISGHKLIIICGPIGSGKTSFLQALLQELPILSGNCFITGKTAFVSQEPWIFTGTLQNNILFGREYDHKKYEEIVNVCALESDFRQLPYGDQTEVGDRGITLSGGQKARVSLARALYQSDNNIFLLDDPLSAVDATISRHIFDKCLKRYLHKSLRILVTHQLQYLPKADSILVFDQGRIIAQGTFSELLDRGIDFVNILTNETEESVSFRRQSLTKLEETEKEVKKDEETRANHVEKMTAGAVSWRTYWKYFRLGDSYAGLVALILGFIISQLFYSATDWWLAFWTNSEEAWSTKPKPPNHIPNIFGSTENISNFLDYSQAVPLSSTIRIENTTAEMLTTNAIKRSRNIFDMLFGTDTYHGQTFYITVYSLFVLFVALSTNLKAAFFFRYCMRISINIHHKMFSSLIRAPIKFYDENPSGRIMNRCTKDLTSMDENLPSAFIDVIEIFLVMIGVVTIVVLSNIYIIIPSILFIVSLWLIRGFYIKTARDIKRLEAITKSPLFTHLTASVQGLTTIRSAKRQEVLIEQFDKLQDVHSAAWFLFISSNRWFGIWLEMISVIFLACVTFSFLSFASSQMSGSVGLAISSVLTLTGTFQWGMRQSAETENLFTSVERTIEYTKIQPEAELDSKPERKPAKTWPNNGAISFSNVSLSYENKTVLDNLSFDIQPGEKIGICGRTGAGKSSILQALFRLTEPSGEILIDGIRINDPDFGLHDLRKNLSIIPQDPLLFSGTIRYNLDPFDQFSDEELWRVLEEVELKPIVPALDSHVLDGGTNFSIGQRQLVCLARAILRKNKIIAMDEITANCDHQTDQFIQSTIRRKFTDCTIIIIAHRLQTIMDCDRVLVMESGRMKEYDHPHILLKNTNGILYSMARNTGKASFDQLKATAYKAYLKKYAEESQTSLSSLSPHQNINQNSNPVGIREEGINNESETDALLNGNYENASNMTSGNSDSDDQSNENQLITGRQSSEEELSEEAISEHSALWGASGKKT